jgi:hypothetical protein
MSDKKDILAKQSKTYDAGLRKLTFWAGFIIQHHYFNPLIL